MTNRQEIPTGRIQGKLFLDTLRFSHKAMATVFEILILHEDAAYARQAAWEAFRELDRLEQELSRFIENSDISRINRLTLNQSIPIGLNVFECIKHALHLNKMTQGAFDITYGSLHEDRSDGENPSIPLPNTSSDIGGQRTTVYPLCLDEDHHSIRLLLDSIHVDLGGIGKGYAIDRMAELLREWEIPSALIHGGMSTVLALAAPPGEEGWPITVSSPQDKKILTRIDLKDRALSGSGLLKGFHIIDPRTGRAVEGRLAAWASTSTGVTSDALSTAFMVMSPEEIQKYCSDDPDTQALIIFKGKGEEEKRGTVLKFGERVEKI